MSLRSLCAEVMWESSGTEAFTLHPDLPLKAALGDMSLLTPLLELLFQRSSQEGWLCLHALYAPLSVLLEVIAINNS